MVKLTANTDASMPQGHSFQCVAAGTQLSVRLFPPPLDSNPVTHFLDIMSEVFGYGVRNCNESDMVSVRLVTKLMCRINLSESALVDRIS